MLYDKSSDWMVMDVKQLAYQIECLFQQSLPAVRMKDLVEKLEAYGSACVKEGRRQALELTPTSENYDG